MIDFDGYRRFRPDRKRLIEELKRLESWLENDLKNGVGEDNGMFYLLEGEDFIKLRAESKIEASCLFFAVRADRFGEFMGDSHEDDKGETA